LAAYFFDSSALVKLYHDEIGTSAVDRLANSGGSIIRISRLTPAELISAFAIKVRTQSISRDDADSLLRQFQSDIATGKLEVFSIGEPQFVMIESLIKAPCFQPSASCIGCATTGRGAQIEGSEACRSVCRS
jgi:hypothetical protein